MQELPARTMRDVAEGTVPHLMMVAVGREAEEQRDQ